VAQLFSLGALRFVKLFAKLLAVIFVSLIFWLGWVWHRTEDMQRIFERIQRGDSQARVVELFGPPRFITSELQTNINWDEEWVDKTNGVRCIQQFHYCPPFTICGEGWVVGFDNRSNAVTKYHLLSP
jgi:hypothetical protein